VSSGVSLLVSSLLAPLQIAGCGIISLVLAHLIVISRFGVAFAEQELSYLRTHNVIGAGLHDELFIASFCYVPLIMAAKALRDAGMGDAILKWKTAYNMAMTAFSFYCCAAMCAWRFRPEFEGYLYGNCLAASEHTNWLGSFSSVSRLFFYSKYVRSFQLSLPFMESPVHTSF
jgi:hypothetical protein